MAAAKMMPQPPPKLTPEEQAALDAKAQGRTYDQATYNRAAKKKVQEQKYLDERNKGKQRGQPRRR